MHVLRWAASACRTRRTTSSIPCALFCTSPLTITTRAATAAPARRCCSTIWPVGGTRRGISGGMTLRRGGRCRSGRARPRLSPRLPASAAAAGSGGTAPILSAGASGALRGQTPADFDLATSATPEEVAACFDRVIATGLQHGTVTVLQGGLALEVTTYRLEGTYSDCRHPDAVRFTRDIIEDLARRDFTINAMAYAPGEGLLDPFGGQQDLERASSAASATRCGG